MKPLLIWLVGAAVIIATGIAVSARQPEVTSLKPAAEFESITDQNARAVALFEEAGKVIMQCLDPNLVPVISSLARNFVVCDHWFSSVPGPTWPNRFFLHAGTANGLLDTPETAGQLRSNFLGSPYRMRSIFENLMDAGHTWKVYYDDYAQTFALRNLHRHVDLFVKFEEFARDVARGTLPAYAFIEPRSFSAPGWPAIRRRWWWPTATTC